MTYDGGTASRRPLFVTVLVTVCPRDHGVLIGLTLATLLLDPLGYGALKSIGLQFPRRIGSRFIEPSVECGSDVLTAPLDQLLSNVERPRVGRLDTSSIPGHDEQNMRAPIGLTAFAYGGAVIRYGDTLALNGKSYWHAWRMARRRSFRNFWHN